MIVSTWIKRAFLVLAIAYAEGEHASSKHDANAAGPPKQRRRLHPSGKRYVLLLTPKGTDNDMSTTSFHRHLLEQGFHLVDDEVRQTDQGVRVLLSEKDIELMRVDDYELGEANKLWINGPNENGFFDVEFINAQEFDQERYIKYASDPSFYCTDPNCASKPMDEFYGSYQFADAIFERMDHLMMQNPDFVEKSSIGKTYQGRDHTIYKLTNYKKSGWESNKVVFYWCGTHPREAMAVMGCPYLMENLLLKELNGSSSDFDLMNGLLNEVTFIILPVLNLDGLHYNNKYNSDIFVLKEALDNGTLDTPEMEEIWWRYYLAKMQRKNMAPNTVRCESASSWKDVGDRWTPPPFNATECIEHFFGVDLNRNWPSHWMGGGADSALPSINYAGLYAADQIETQNIMGLIKELAENKRLLSSVDVHCCVDMFFVPTGWHPCKTSDENGKCLETYGEAFDLPLLQDWGRVVTDAIYKVNGNQFYYGDSTTLYGVSGSSVDWVYEKFGIIYTAVIELRQDPRSARTPISIDVFYPPNDLITPSIKGEIYMPLIF
jgi:murein tripeptide amidase MpaA